MSDELTQYGFTFGAAEITRLISMPDGQVCIRVATPYRSVDVYVSPTGRSLRVFGGSSEWKPVAVPSSVGVQQ